MSSRSEYRTRERDSKGHSHSVHRHNHNSSNSSNRKRESENPSYSNDETESKREKRGKEYSPSRPSDSQSHSGEYSSLNDSPRRTSRYREPSRFPKRSSPDRSRDKYTRCRDRSREPRQDSSAWTREKKREQSQESTKLEYLKDGDACGLMPAQTKRNNPHTSGHGRSCGTKPEDSHMRTNSTRTSNLESPLRATPGAAKLVEEVEKRKLLFSKKKPDDTSSSVWDQTKFSHDSDGAMTAKFKRLMGIKYEGSGVTCNERPPQGKTNQEEYFANLEKQYEVARATTHTQRGVGLGFTTARLCPPKS